jgi:hypothetical protein
VFIPQLLPITAQCGERMSTSERHTCAGSGTTPSRRFTEPSAASGTAGGCPVRRRRLTLDERGLLSRHSYPHDAFPVAEELSNAISRQLEPIRRAADISIPRAFQTLMETYGKQLAESFRASAETILATSRALGGIEQLTLVPAEVMDP